GRRVGVRVRVPLPVHPPALSLSPTIASGRYPLWVAVLGGIVFWLVHLTAEAALVGPACHHRDVRWVMHAVTAATGAATVAATACAYGVGATRVWRRAGPGRVVHRGHVAAFGAGLAVVALALTGPLDAGAEGSLSLHMLQHVLLISVAAPLLVMGAPMTALPWALPPGPRQVAGRWGRRLNHSFSGRAWAWWTAGARGTHVVA